LQVKQQGEEQEMEVLKKQNRKVGEVGDQY